MGGSIISILGIRRGRKETKTEKETEIIIIDHRNIG